MLDEARLLCPSLTEATQFVSSRFDPNLRELLFVPDEAGRKKLEESPAPLLETKPLRLNNDRIELRVPLSLQIHKAKMQYRSRMQKPH